MSCCASSLSLTSNAPYLRRAAVVILSRRSAFICPVETSPRIRHLHRSSHASRKASSSPVPPPVLRSRIDIVLAPYSTSKAPDNSSASGPTPPDEEPQQQQQQRVYSLREMQHQSTRLSYDRNFITAVRAMHDFLLKPDHLSGLRVTSRRSPHDNAPPLNVYWRKDVEAKSLEVWGSWEAVEEEKKRREKVKDSSKREGFSSYVKSYMKKRREDAKSASARLSRESWPVRTMAAKQTEEGLESETGKVVLSAVAINTANTVGKLVAWIMSGSHAMFSEAIHSAADTANQLILVYGLRKSAKTADEKHPYGYSNMPYVSSLISGVGIFCMGAGLSIYHGLTGLVNPHPIESLTMAFLVLSASFVSESITLALAIKSIRESAARHDMSFLEFVVGGYDPCVNVVLLEDMAAVLGVVIAAGSMTATTVLGSHIPDAVGSLAIGGLLGSVASFMIYTNTTALVGRSIPEEKLILINRELEGDIMVRQIHDVKGIDMGNGVIRYKAEVDVDGRELALYYLRKNHLDKMFKEVRAMQSEKELELFLLQHGENIVDCLGEQVDRIEKQLKQTHPEVKHVDLEVL